MAALTLFLGFLSAFLMTALSGYQLMRGPVLPAKKWRNNLTVVWQIGLTMMVMFVALFVFDYIF